MTASTIKTELKISPLCYDIHTPEGLKEMTNLGACLGWEVSPGGKTTVKEYIQNISLFIKESKLASKSEADSLEGFYRDTFLLLSRKYCELQQPGAEESHNPIYHAPSMIAGSEFAMNQEAAGHSEVAALRASAAYVGVAWPEIISLILLSLKLLSPLSLFHEFGDWWPSKLKTDQTSAADILDIFSTNGISSELENLGITPAFFALIIDLNKFGVDIDKNVGCAIERWKNFLSGNNEINLDKNNIRFLAECVRIGDWSQLVTPPYAEPFVPEVGSEKTLFASALLALYEFKVCRPNALKGLSWYDEKDQISWENIGVDSFIYDLFTDNFLKLIDKSLAFFDPEACTIYKQRAEALKPFIKKKA